MNINKKVGEAVVRLKMLGVHQNVIDDFNGKGYHKGKRVINYSEKGILYWVEDDKWKEIISKFEKEYDALVYHVIYSHTNLGDMLSLLYVSDDEDEWGMDREAIAEGFSYAYVENLDDPFLSEIGSIGIEPVFGGVVRTY